MRKAALNSTVTAIALGMSALAASAQSQSLSANALHVQSQNFTSITKQVACRRDGTDAMGCDRGWTWSSYRKRCVRCY